MIAVDKFERPTCPSPEYRSYTIITLDTDTKDTSVCSLGTYVPPPRAADPARSRALTRRDRDDPRFILLRRTM